MRKLWLVFLAAGLFACGRAYAECETNHVDPEQVLAELMKIPLPDSEKETMRRRPILYRLLQNRLTYAATNTFGPFRALEFERELQIGGTGFFDHLGGEVASVWRTGGRNALREFALQEVPFVWNAQNNWASAIRNTFTGFEEKDHPTSPLNPSEGLPGQDGIREPRSFKFGWRPFRTDPYLFATWVKRDRTGERLFTTSLRGYGDDWQRPRGEFVGEVPLVDSISIVSGAGIRTRDSDSETLVGSLGFAGSWRKGIFYAAATYPLGFNLTFHLLW